MSKQNIKIPAKHYVGLVKRQNESIPLAFITPWGEDAAAKKRIATVDAWSKQGYRRNDSLPSMTIDNVPMSGFKMTTDIRSSSYGGSDKWRIEDPRGFELEITSHNLAQLLSVGMIDRGEIADTCVWARDGQTNVLLSTSTDEYKEAVENTQVAAMTASWKDVKIGNTVLLQNNVKGVWLGRMHGIHIIGGYGYQAEDNQVAVTAKPTHVIYIDQPDKTYKHRLLLVNNPKLASIVSEDTKTDAEAEILANSLLTDKTCYVEHSGYKSYIALILGAPKLGKTALLSLEPIEINSEEDLVNKTGYNGTQRIFVQPGGHSFYEVVSNKNYHKNTVTFNCEAYNYEEFKNHQLIPIRQMIQQTGYYASRSPIWKQKQHHYLFSDKDTFYTLKISIKTKSGNTIETVVR